MKFDELLESISNIDQQIAELTRQKEKLRETHKAVAQAYHEERRAIEKKWIIKNSNLLRKTNTDSSAFSSIVVDCFQLAFVVKAPGAGFTVNAVSLKNLCDAWNNGFCHENNPIVSYRYTRGNTVKIRYIQNQEIRETEIPTETDPYKNIVHELYKNRLKPDDFAHIKTVKIFMR